MVAFFPERKTIWPVAKSNIFTLWAIMVTDYKNVRQHSRGEHLICVCNPSVNKYNLYKKIQKKHSLQIVDNRSY